MAGKLKPLDIQREEKPGKYADGDGLYLMIAGPTSKNWSYRYWFKGKERWHGLGSFKDVSLRDARLARDAARLHVRAGVNLVQEKRAAREEKKAAEAVEKAKTFEECAQAYIDELERLEQEAPCAMALLAQALRPAARSKRKLVKLMDQAATVLTVELWSLASVTQFIVKQIEDDEPFDQEELRFLKSFAALVGRLCKDQYSRERLAAQS